MQTRQILITSSPDGPLFDLRVTATAGEAQAMVHLSHFHTNVVQITRNKEVVFQGPTCDGMPAGGTKGTDRSLLTVAGIVDFAETVRPDDVQALLDRQIAYNFRIAEAGLAGDWGANIGSLLLEIWGQDIRVRAKALAAAGSDARMSGCDLPVVIVSGSGNQGITASVPVIAFARDMGQDPETLYRALVVANLITIHLKTGIGRLSAYCGAISAGAGAGAGIAWLHGGRFEEIAHTLVNALAIASGIICDGAKPSCAAKIVVAVEAGLMGFYMFQNGRQFYDGEGIVRKGVENTIANIGRLGREGMRETDREIIRMMLEI